MTTEVNEKPAAQPTPSDPVKALNRAFFIGFAAMAVVLVCIVIVLVVVTFNERSTQANADSNARALETLTEQLEEVTQQNTRLEGELTCLRQPTFGADKADATLAITTARGLAEVAASNAERLAELGDDLLANADALEAAFDVRQEAIDECAKDPTWVPTP